MNRKTTIVLAVTTAVLLTASSTGSARAPAAPPAPPSFAGMVPQGVTSDADYALMRSSGVRSVRLPMYWLGIESEGPNAEPDFSGFDAEVLLAAENGLRVYPFVWGTPAWAGESIDLPTETALQRRAWSSFLRRAAKRYGPSGSFWREHDEVPYLPIRMWEIWNEENIVTFSSSTDPVRYAEVLRAAGRVLHHVDPGSRVILGGLFGRPLQIPPNTASGDFLNRLYESGNVKPFFDGVALHPYVADAKAMEPQIRNLRRVMLAHHDAATPLYVTELGWGSDSYESRWERGLHGQARELNQAMSMLVRHRRSWRIGGVWWFSWRDDTGALCQFCDSAGLLTIAREAKPAWYAFNHWTGGNPGTVPRARIP